MSLVDNALYRDYCARHRDTLPIFHQDWWLDAVVGKDQWIGLVSKKQVAEKAAILPVFRQQRWGLKIIRNPVLTPYQGPWWAGLADASSRQQHKVANQLWPDLIRQLPSNHSFRQRFHPDVRLVLPWHQAKYKLGLRYTYTLNLADQLDALEAQLRRDIRRKIRHHNEWTISESKSIADFLPLVNTVYARQQKNLPYSVALLERLFAAAQSQGQSHLLMAEKDGQTLGGVWIVHDPWRMYILASGLTEQGRRNGAFPNLIWHILQRWQGKPAILDFCGSMLPQVADSNSAYGARAILVAEVEKQAKWLKVLSR